MFPRFYFFNSSTDLLIIVDVFHLWHVFFFINSLDISGCRDVTVPVDESNEEVTERLREKIKNGEYTIGELIVPQKFIKTTLCGNRIEKGKMEISGQKIDIIYIRKKLLEKNEKFM